MFVTITMRSIISLLFVSGDIENITSLEDLVEGSGLAKALPGRNGGQGACLAHGQIYRKSTKTLWRIVHSKASR